MALMYRCPGELRHVTRGFLYDQREQADREAAMADGWFDTLDEAAGLVAPSLPEPIPKPEPEPEPAAPSREAIVAELEARGVDVDKRWGDKRLASELAKAKG
jgi:hypothetical protein